MARAGSQREGAIRKTLRGWALLVCAALLEIGCAEGSTLRSVTIAPRGAVLESGTSMSFHANCAYDDGSEDDCRQAGGIRWRSSRPDALTVGSAGLAVWRQDPGAGQVGVGYVLAEAGGQTDRAEVLAQHPGDTWTEYMTPDERQFQDTSTGVPLPLDVVVGATVTVGAGIVVNQAGAATGIPFQGVCTWSSSEEQVATVDRHGQLLARSPGTTTVRCGRAGTARFGESSLPGWRAPGDTLRIHVVEGSKGTTTWYVRPDGGTPYVSAAATPGGQCDGRHDAPYPGSGANRPCAVRNLRDLWADRVTPHGLRWRIAGGDTVLVRPNGAGYAMNLDMPSPYEAPGLQSWSPINCQGNTDCTMPPIPSGTAARHTRIVGANFADCRSDAAKTKLWVSFAGRSAFNLKDSQFVDVACFEISDRAECARNGNFTRRCAGTANYGKTGIEQSALTSEVTYTDLFLHGLAGTAIRGATGVGVVLDRIHIRAVPDAGIDMDDSPWNSGNISVAGGLTMRGSVVEFAGCVEEYPVRHSVPMAECRDQETGGYGDGLGTGSAVGDWVFDHDTWRYNFQDGLDLLHSGMQRVEVTNSVAAGNVGQAFKFGPSDEVVFRNTVAIGNCRRVLEPVGDEPSSALVPGVDACRAGGGWVVLQFTDGGRYTVESNSFAGYGATPIGLECAEGWAGCAHAAAVFRNNVVLGYRNPEYNGGRPLALFFLASRVMPPHHGWSVRDHNLFFGVRFRYCPFPLQDGESCNAEDPLFLGEPASPIHAESDLDALDLTPREDSPLVGSGAMTMAAVSGGGGVRARESPVIGALWPQAESSSAPSNRAEAPRRHRRLFSLQTLWLLWQERPNLLRWRYLLLGGIASAAVALQFLRGRRA